LEPHFQLLAWMFVGKFFLIMLLVVVEYQLLQNIKVSYIPNKVIGNTVSIAQTTKGNLNSLSGEIVISGEVTVEDDTPLTGGRLDSLTVTGKFDLPHGGSEDREETPEKGSTRFNQDLGQLEFYTGL
jgi:hypothetical protein